MITKDYFNKVANSGEDFLQAFIDLLEKREIALNVKKETGYLTLVL